jgi:hypothetical protein
MKRLAVIPFICLLVSQAFGKEPAPWIELERTGCHGICPVFTVRLFRDGRVEYLGKKFVVEVGIQHGRIKRGAAERLQRMLDDLNVERLSPDCCSCIQVTDQPWSNVEIVAGKETHRVRHYHGCELAPAGLSQLEEEILMVSGVSRWIGSESERARRREVWFRQVESDRFGGL